MKARTLILTASTLVALAVPATGTAAVLDRSGVSVKPAKVTKLNKGDKTGTSSKKGNKRVLCICIVNPGPSTWVGPTIEELQAAYDADMIAHGFEAVYNTGGFAVAAEA